MDATYSWHQGADPLNTKWAFSIPLLPDELFSSWLLRAAFAQGCDPLSFTSSLWPKWRIWTFDVDRMLTDERQAVLSDVSGISPSSFSQALLQSILSKIYNDKHLGRTFLPWMLALGSRSRYRFGGLQFCPLCFAEDQEPYFRINWRFAWHTGCVKHGVRLLDRCPICGNSVQPQRLVVKDQHLALCCFCKTDFRSLVHQEVDQQALLFQSAADEVVKVKCGHYSNEPIAPEQWFSIARYFVMLLRKAGGERSKKLIVLLRMLGVKDGDMLLPATGLPLEFLPVEERKRLFSGAWTLMNVRQEVFAQMIRQISLSRSSLIEKNYHLPGFVKEFLDELPSMHVCRMPVKRRKREKTVSRTQVLRKWARLQRKLHNGRA